MKNLSPLLRIIATAAPLLLPAALASQTDYDARMRYAEIFRQFDTPEEVFDDIDCRDDLDDQLCPMQDDMIPCSGEEAIEKFCREVLGEDIVKTDEGKPKLKGMNALEGCKTYVSWDDSKAVCCPSDSCFDAEYGDEDDEFFEDDDSYEYEYGDEDIEEEEF